MNTKKKFNSKWHLTLNENAIQELLHSNLNICDHGQLIIILYRKFKKKKKKKKKKRKEVFKPRGLIEFKYSNIE